MWIFFAVENFYLLLRTSFAFSHYKLPCTTHASLVVLSLLIERHTVLVTQA